jgi:hypothetical protein
MLLSLFGKQGWYSPGVASVPFCVFDLVPLSVPGSVGAMGFPWPQFLWPLLRLLLPPLSAALTMIHSDETLSAFLMLGFPSCFLNCSDCRKMLTTRACAVADASVVFVFEDLFPDVCDVAISRRDNNLFPQLNSCSTSAGLRVPFQSARTGSGRLSQVLAI